MAMMHCHRYFSKEQVTVMYRLAKERGVPVDSMCWSEFIAYVYAHDLDILDQSSYPMPLLASSQVIENKPATLLFDSEKLYWQQKGNSSAWFAYSGKERIIKTKDYSIEAQKSANEGPIPEGWYLVPQEKYQERPDEWWEGLKNTFGRGAWPGGQSSWGDQRIWLEPEGGTNTYGRTGMSIHGGETPGSRGCIDLVHSMGDFAKRFREYGKSMRLEVKYPK